jgi:hypothetical protein
VAAIAAILVAFVPSPVPAFITNSRMMPYAAHIAAALAEAAPRDLKDSFFQEWQNLKRFWDRQKDKEQQAQFTPSRALSKMEIAHYF